jgi:hypothetical protein
MAHFLHLIDARSENSISKGGIRISRSKFLKIPGVYCFPVLNNYYYSHQWLRELKRKGIKEILAVHIRIPDNEKVWVGYFGSEHRNVEANRAIRIILETEKKDGFEVIIPRKVNKNEIISVYKPSQIVGWRYYPNSHGKKPCGCPYCQKGQIKNKKLRERHEKD